MRIFTLANFSFLQLIMGTVVFIELLINFKKPLTLKLILLAIVLACLWKGFGMLYMQSYTYNRWLSEQPSTILAGSFILLLALLKNEKFIFAYLLYAIIIIISLLSLSIYYSFFEQIPVYIPITQIANYIHYLWIGFTIATIILTSILLFKLIASTKMINSYISQLNNWAILITSVFLFSCIAFLTISISNNPLLGNYINVIFDTLLVFLILFRPNIINNNHLRSINTPFNPKQLNEIDESEFTLQFFYNKYYLKVDANMEDFAEIVGFKPEVIRKHIATNYQFSFIELTNKNRVLAFLELVKTDKVKNYTIEGLAKECGFSSRFHLYNNFKKFHGGTPGDYIKTIQG